MALSRHRHFIAWLTVLFGAATIGAGAALIYLPAGLVVWGFALVALGLLTDVDGGGS